MSKKRIVVVCPGRGTYTKETLGYLQKYGKHVSEFISDIDQRRKKLGEFSISEMDNMPTFQPNIHTKGENASSLIYACAYADFMAIDREKYDIVAITGNSMGWYLACAFGGALGGAPTTSENWASSFSVINTMGSMMKNETIGGQVIYPLIDEKWNFSQEKMDQIRAAVDKVNQREGCEVYDSIYLGGYIVLGANKAGTQALLKELPPFENYPFQLINHAAFHTPLLKSTSEKAFQILPEELFQKPETPMIDGRGHIWQPYSTDVRKLYQYTLGHQVYASYDFTKAITVALKEFAPDHLFLLGPGGSLGGSIGQIMIKNDWRAIKNKDDFSRSQELDLVEGQPFLVSMGRR